MGRGARFRKVGKREELGSGNAPRPGSPPHSGFSPKVLESSLYPDGEKPAAFRLLRLERKSRVGRRLESRDTAGQLHHPRGRPLQSRGAQPTPQWAFTV